jgi:hypothetical protein
MSDEVERFLRGHRFWSERSDGFSRYWYCFSHCGRCDQGVELQVSLLRWVQWWWVGSSLERGHEPIGISTAPTELLTMDAGERRWLRVPYTKDDVRKLKAHSSARKPLHAISGRPLNDLFRNIRPANLTHRA